MPGPDDIVERFEGLFDGHCVIPAVDLVQVHVVHLQALQGFVDRVQDMLARETLVVDVIAHLPVDLGGDDHVLTLHAEMPEKIAGDLLAFSQGIDVRRVEEVDARLECAFDKGLCLFFVQDPLTPGL